MPNITIDDSYEIPFFIALGASALFFTSTVFLACRWRNSIIENGRMKEQNEETIRLITKNIIPDSLRTVTFAEGENRLRSYIIGATLGTEDQKIQAKEEVLDESSGKTSDGAIYERAKPGIRIMPNSIEECEIQEDKFLIKN